MSHKCFSHRDCEHFPCHDGIDPQRFNCLFCYCPLYSYPVCPGNRRLLPDGRKDCSACRLPHAGERAWDLIHAHLPKR